MTVVVRRRLKGGRIWDTSIHDPQLRRLVEEGLDDREIGERMGFLPATIQQCRYRLRLILARREPERAPRETTPPVTEERPNPIGLAMTWLGPRMTETPSGYRLDGVPANLQTIMRAANGLLKRAGQAQVGPEHWRV